MTRDQLLAQYLTLAKLCQMLDPAGLEWADVRDMMTLVRLEMESACAVVLC